MHLIQTVTNKIHRHYNMGSHFNMKQYFTGYINALKDVKTIKTSEYHKLISLVDRLEKKEIM